MNEAEVVRRLRALYPGVCVLCLEPMRSEWEGLLQPNGRLRYGALRTLAVNHDVSYRHRRHRGRTFTLPYYEPTEWQRRKGNAARLKRWWWEPGQSGGGTRLGHPDKRPRRRPQGIFAAREAERRERAERLQQLQLALLSEEEGE